MEKLFLNVIAFVFMFITSFCMYLYLTVRKNEKKNIKDYFKLSYNKYYLILTGISLIISIGIYLYDFYVGEIAYMQAFMNTEMFFWVITLGYIDLKEKIIPNKMILAGLGFWLVLMIFDIFVAKSPLRDVLFFSLIGGLCCGGIMFIVALISRGALGMGDVKMFFVLGLMYGVSVTYSILLFSVFIMAIFSIVMLALKKVTRKTSVPMAPFVVMGFLINVLFGM